MKKILLCIASLMLTILMINLSYSSAEKSNVINTTLYLNDEIYDQFERSEVKISKSEWSTWKKDEEGSVDYVKIYFNDKWTVRLNVINNSNTIWQKPKIKIRFSDNWGHGNIYIQTLLPIEAGKAADFIIPLNSYSVRASDRTSVWLQIWIDKKGAPPIDEVYYCIKFDLSAE
ncbi:MAG: hypothetical protein IJ563_05565 [Selenomonadaceae bacterium]|nr:hypothetical protein [Selenomonadaceae bacterium]MBR1859431.1 hypothetical protein [Selenomonadaceae bacterium]